MKRRVWILLAVLGLVIVTGCGEKEQFLPEVTQPAEEEMFSFEQLSERQFEFMSGAGGWSEDFTIERDGYFTGNFRDSDMGDVGDEYPEGTIYCCSYSGHFTGLTKIDEYTYEMKLSDISYEQEADRVVISQNVRYIYTDSYCLGGGDIFKVYLPGKPLSEISDSVRMWISPANGDENLLTMIVIADETNGYGIYSYDRLQPLEDARMSYNSCKELFDYYGDKLKDALTTMEMVEYTGSMYSASDDCLNYIWNLVRYNVDEEAFERILEEQRAWIVEKEAAGNEILASDGGSFAAVDYNDVMAQMTLKRCEQLIGYLEQ